MTTISPASPDHQPATGATDPWLTQPLAVTVPHDTVSYRITSRTTLARSARSRSARPTGYFLLTLLVVFALLNLGDLASTYLGLAHGLNEGNPLMSGLLSHYGFGALIVDKLIVIAAVTWGALLLYKLNWRIAHTIALVCDTLVLLVVVSNIVQYVAIR
jgi:hypothetical protein